MQNVDHASLNLLRAAQTGDTSAARLAIEQGANLYTNPLKLPPLYVALQRGHANFVQLLIESGINVNAAIDDFQATPLLLASSTSNLNIVNYLLSKGAKVNLSNRYKVTPLYNAAVTGNLAIVESLLAAGAVVNACAIDHSTPLFQAVVYEHLTIVQRLLGAGANPNQCAKAAPKIDRLLQRANATAQSFQAGETPLFIAVRKGNMPIIEALLQAGANANVVDATQKTCLVYAVSSEQSNKLLIIRRLIAAGADVKRRYYTDCNLLHFAVMNPEQDIEMLRYLLEEVGLDPNMRAKTGGSVLSFAIMSKHRLIVEYLIDRINTITAEDLAQVTKNNWLDIAFAMLPRVQAEASGYIAILEEMNKQLIEAASAASLPLLVQMVEHMIAHLQPVVIMRSNYKSTGMVKTLIAFFQRLEIRQVGQKEPLLQLLMNKMQSLEPAFSGKKATILYKKLLAAIVLDNNVETLTELSANNSLLFNKIRSPILQSALFAIEHQPAECFPLESATLFNSLLLSMSEQGSEFLLDPLMTKVVGIMDYINNEADNILAANPQHQLASQAKQAVSNFFAWLTPLIEKLTQANTDPAHTAGSERIALQQQIHLQQAELGTLQQSNEERLQRLTITWQDEIIKKLQAIHYKLNISCLSDLEGELIFSASIQLILQAVTTELTRCLADSQKLPPFDAQAKQYQCNQLLRYRQSLLHMLQAAEELDRLLHNISTSQQRFAQLAVNLKSLQDKPADQSDEETLKGLLSKSKAEYQMLQKESEQCYENIVGKVRQLSVELKALFYFVQFSSPPVRKEISSETHLALSSRLHTLANTTVKSQLVHPQPSPAITKETQDLIASRSPVLSLMANANEVTVLPYGVGSTMPSSLMMHTPMQQTADLQQLFKSLEQLKAVGVLAGGAQLAELYFIIYLPYLVNILNSLQQCLPTRTQLKSDCLSLRNFLTHGFHILLAVDSQSSVTMRSNASAFLQASLFFVKDMINVPIASGSAAPFQLPLEISSALQRLIQASQCLSQLSLASHSHYKGKMQLGTLVNSLLNKQYYIISRSVSINENLLLCFSLLRFCELIGYFYKSTAAFPLKVMQDELQNPSVVTVSGTQEQKFLFGFIFVLGEAVQQIRKAPRGEELLKELITYYKEEQLNIFSVLLYSAKRSRDQASHHQVISFQEAKPLILDLIALLALRGQALDLLRIAKNLMENYLITS